MCVVAVDQQEMTNGSDDTDADMFMNTSVNESPYFVHEPSSSNSVKKSANVSHSLSVREVLASRHLIDHKIKSWP